MSPWKSCVKGVRSRRRLASLAALGATLLVGGCGEESRFFIVQNQVPEPGCLIPTDRSQVYIGRGRMDVTLVGDEQAFGYQIYPLVQNDMPSVGEEGAPEPNRLFIKGFRVSLRLAGTPAPAAQKVFADLAADETGRRFLDFDTRWAGTVDPGDVMSAALGGVPGEIARRLRQAGVFASAPTVPLTVGVRALGERTSGDMESTEFRFPVDACEGCLVAFHGTCPIAARANAGHACNMSQDDLVDCCLEGGVARCPAPVQEKNNTPATP